MTRRALYFWLILFVVVQAASISITAALLGRQASRYERDLHQAICVSLAQQRILALAEIQIINPTAITRSKRNPGSYNLSGTRFDDQLPPTTALCNGKTTLQVLREASRKGE